MESILREIVGGTVNSIISLIEDRNLLDLMVLGQEIRDLTDHLGIEILKTVVEEIDSVLLDNQSLRRKDGLRVQARNVERTVLLPQGELKFQRTYYRYGKNGYCYLTDQVIGLKPYERISKDLIAGILNRLPDVSYRGAAEHSGTGISAQTVHDRLLAAGELVSETERMKETPEALELFADEDHVHRNDGKPATVPLITITEGIDREQKRHKTIRPFHLEGYGMESGAFRENLLAVLEERYDMGEVRTIRVHGDGGTWIQGLSEILPGMTFLMDEFHIEQYMKSLQNRTKDAEKRRRLRTALENNDPEGFFVTGVEIAQEQEKAGEKEVHELLGYFRNNWESIQNRKQSGEEVCGSCTEGQISAVLSRRLSRDPLGWSEAGLKQMAALLVYAKNGNKVTPKQIRVSRKAAEAERKEFRENSFRKYAEYAEKQTKQYLQSAHDWSIYDPVQEKSGKRTGTQVILKALGSLRDNFLFA